MWWVFIAIFLYVLVLLLYYYGEKKMPLFSLNEKDSTTTFSVVIPFRNEANNLPDLLETIRHLNYPKSLYEIFLVNDASEDNSVEIITAWINENSLQANVQLIDASRSTISPKKDAISTAVSIASYDWILTTDADCELPGYLLQAYDAFIQEKQPDFVAGPVVYRGNESFLQQYQVLDGLSLQAITMGSFGWKKPILCNGANMAYKRTTFIELNGFSGNNHIASGDDIFMLEKVAQKYPKQVGYLKSNDAIVSTKTQRDWGGVLNQRIRWASKTGKQKSLLPKLIALLVLYTNLIVLVTPIVFITKPLQYGGIAIIAVLIKFSIDYFIIHNCAGVLKVKVPFFHFLVSFCVYPIIFLVVLMGSFLHKYQWKGRSFRR